MRNQKIRKILFVFSALGLITVPFSISAATADDIAQQKRQKQAQLDILNKQITDYQNQIAQKSKQAASLSNEVKLYDLEITATQLRIQATQTNIDNTGLQIDETKDQIKQKSDQIEQEKKVLAQLLVTLNEYDNTSGIQLGLSSNNFSDFMDQVQYTQSIQSKVFDLIQKIKDIRAKLESDEKDLQTNLDKLNELNDQLNATKATLSDQKNAKVALLTQTKGQESRYKQLLSSTQAQENQIQKEIQDLDNQVSGSHTYAKLPVVHGVLAWPMDGVLTQGYGNTGFTSLGYNFHNGVDIAAPAGTPIYAAGDGVVIATGTGTTAYGNWVAIKHSAGGKLDRDIVTLYGHMRTFVVSKGKSMKQGDLIGYEGNTGNTSRLLYGPDHGYHVHFTVFDAVGFGVNPGAYPKVYGPYTVPFGHTYDPRDFL